MSKLPHFVFLGILSGVVWANDPKPAEHASPKAEAKPAAKAEAKPATHADTKPAEGKPAAAKADAKADAKPAAHAEAKPAVHGESKAAEPKRTAPAKPVVHAAAPRAKTPVRARTAAIPAIAPPPMVSMIGAGNNPANGAYVLVPAASFMASQGVIPIQMMMQPASSPAADPHAIVATNHDPTPQAVHTAPHHLPPAVPPVVTVEEALTELKKGNERHTDADYNHDHHSHRRLEEVAKGQKPHAIILTCSDSRVPPELLFDKGLGDLFVIRVAGNIAGASELASIEYAAEHLNVPLVVVMGHKRCGAIQAAAAGGDAGGHIAALVRQIEPAVQKARNLPGDLVDNAVHTNIDQVVRDLRNSDPILKELVMAGRLKVLGAYYDIDTGKVDWMY